MSKPGFDIRVYKKNLRQKYRTLRESYPPEVKGEKDRRICQAVRRLKEYKSCRTLLCYVSTPSEVDTHALIGAALRDGKSVAVPRCIPGTRLMDFYKIDAIEQLSPGTFGVLEPDPDSCEKLVDFRNSLCVLPGISFDRFGYRLGYGGGYYDRFLSGTYLQAEKVTTAGICYHSCTRPFLVHGRFDVPCHYLVTENGWRKVEARRTRRSRRRAPGRKGSGDDGSPC